MRSFKHFTLEERELLQEMLRQGKRQTEIATALLKSQSSISREIRRVRDGTCPYLPIRAQRAYERARKRSVRVKRLKSPEILHDVTRKLKKKWSPEIIANTQVPELKVSFSTIYRALKRREIPGLTEANALRRRGKRKYCRGGGKTIHSGRSIHLRDEVVNQRQRIGDWEGDAVLGAVGKGLLVTLIDRKSRFLLMATVPSKHAGLVRETVVRLLKRRVSHTITFDNGSEFAEYEAIEKETKALVYFADTHSPWQRGSNENVNELIRWYFPKGTDFTKVTEEQVRRVCDEINHRPRKILNWNTPAMVFRKICI